MPHQTVIATNGQTLTVNASVSHWTSAALAAAASGTNDVESTTTTTITSDYSLFFADTATTATITVKQADGTTLFSKALEVGPGVGTRRIAPVPDPYQQAADVPSGLLSGNQILTSGFATFDRLLISSGITCTTQVLRAVCFTAPRTMTVGSMKVWTNGTAAAATPTLVRFGLFTMDSADEATLVASTANDTTLLASTNTAYTKALSASYEVTQGARYAAGALVVTAATAPGLGSCNAVGAASIAAHATAPRIGFSVTGQTDLPATVATGSMTALGNVPYFELIPA